MKLTTFILIISLMQVSAASFGQRITLKQRGIALEDVFREIRSQTGYDVLVGTSKFQISQKIDANFQDSQLTEVMDKIVKVSGLSYTIEGKTVVIKEKKTPSFLEKVVGVFQDINVSGRVVDAEGRGLPGASVSVKGKGGKAVSTAANGNFYLKGVNEDAVLVISFMGYVPKEIQAAKELGDIVLEVSSSKLDEVQVIAYGTTTQRLSTGNVTTVKAADIEKQPVNNPLLALQGRVPGLFIEQASGFAGTGVKVRIQGTNSINNGNDPLYVIDGIPFSSQLLQGGNPILNGSAGLGDRGAGSPLNFINPSDIESIDILKDADATSIYGSRAANGAILITTKKGREGDAKISLNMQHGIGKVSRKMDLMSRDQYLEMRKEAFRNDGIDVNSPPYTTDLYKSLLYPDISGFWDINRNTDWQKELLGGSAQYTDIQGSVSGGAKDNTYLIGGNYHKETNVFPGEYADLKGSMHFNISSTSTNSRFKAQFTGSYLQDNNSLPGDDLTGMALTLAPVAPQLYNADGGINFMPNSSGESSFNNPLQYLNNKFKNKTWNLIGNSVLSYKILKELELKSNFGYNSLRSDIVFAQPKLMPEELEGSNGWPTKFASQSLDSWLIEPYFNFIQNLLSGKLEVMLGGTVQQRMSKASSLDASGFGSVQVMEDLKSATILTPTLAIQEKYKYTALFGRINYNFNDSYIFNLSIRRDGSSRFGAENRFHNFWAVGTAWIFSNLKFLKEHLSFLSYGKIRASYGTTGSDQIGEYKFLSLYNSVNFEVPYQGINGYTPSGLSNPYLQWEETKKLQAGADIGVFNDRILFGVNFSLNRSSNQLLLTGLPIQTGFNNIPANFGATVQNRGWEFSLTTSNIARGKFKWHSNLNVTLPKNKLLKFLDFENSGYNSTFSIGKSVNLQHLYHFLGVDPQTGLYQVADRNGNPTVNPIRFGGANTDATMMVTTDPKFYGGFQNTFIYKGFQLDLMFSFAKQITQNYSFGNTFQPGFRNMQQPEGQVTRWQKPGDLASVQKYSTTFDSGIAQDNAKNSDAGWSDTYYVRLKNLSLSWQLPDSWKNAIRTQTCRIFLQGQNLLTFTDYTGLDPETKSSSSLPPLKVLTLGVQISF